MTYPQTPGFQSHSETSRKAAERLTTADSMEKDIFQLLDDYPTGWTGDELAAYLHERGYAGVQTGTIAARLRGLELKGKAVKTTDTRPTRSQRRAFVWVSKRLADANGLTLAPTANGPTVQELQAKVTRLELENEQLRKKDKWSVGIEQQMTMPPKPVAAALMRNGRPIAFFHIDYREQVENIVAALMGEA